MCACVQRVSQAEVVIDGKSVGRIERGLLVLLGVAVGDSDEAAKQLAQKIADLRVFEDDAGKMNRSLAEVGGAMLVGEPIHALGRLPQRPPAEFHRCRATGGCPAALSAVRFRGAELRHPR